MNNTPAAAIVREAAKSDAVLAQSLMVSLLADVLVVAGYRASVVEYGGGKAVAVGGGEGLAVVVAPLLPFIDDEVDSLHWEFAVTGSDAVHLERAGEPVYGCPSIWDVCDAGTDLEMGLRFVEDAVAMAGREVGFALAVLTRPALPGAAAGEFPQFPYPGQRPEGSWVLDAQGRVHPVSVDAAMSSGWAVSTLAEGSVCLDRWLVSQGASPMAGRVPVLSYGSNACPAKALDNRTLPAVNLACRMEDLAAAWCAGVRGHGDVPATLVGVRGHCESAFVTFCTQDDLRRLDVIEGRTSASPVYELVVLEQGRVVLDNGYEVARALAYVGARESRWPLCLRGEVLLLSRASQDAAARLLTSGTPRRPVPLGPVVDEAAFEFRASALSSGHAY